jgi:hypothetical protein
VAEPGGGATPPGRWSRQEGYEVVHFTWQELFSDPAGIAGRIRAAFDRAIRLGR